MLLIVPRSGKSLYTNEITPVIQQKLREVNWNEVKQPNNANKSYTKSSEKCTSLY